jgi:integron integrase
MRSPNPTWNDTASTRGASVLFEQTRRIAVVPSAPRLLDHVRLELRARHYSPKTEKSYVAWIRRFAVFHDKRHPSKMGANEVRAFLSWLATEKHISASTHNQALSALLFQYRDVLGGEIGWIDHIVPAKRAARLPVVLTTTEVRALLRELEGTSWLMASLMYGSGLRLMECCRLRVKDLDLERNELIVRDGKGQKDRVTVLPAALNETLRAHIATVKAQHQRDLEDGLGAVALPGALERKYPAAAREWGWQWVFPASRSYADRETGELQRHPDHSGTPWPS